jgi:hypothetical protein
MPGDNGTTTKMKTMGATTKTANAMKTKALASARATHNRDEGERDTRLR